MKIIKKPIEEFRTLCEFCGCEISYELNDVDRENNTITCPHCNTSINHNAKRQPRKMTTFSKSELGL